MKELKDFALYNIDWDLTPEQAVTMYLEWGNNDWNSEYPPVRYDDDESQYFVIDSWHEPPLIKLIKRTTEKAEELFTMTLPPELEEDWKKANGDLHGISAPTPVIKAWLKKQLGQENIKS